MGVGAHRDAGEVHATRVSDTPRRRRRWRYVPRRIDSRTRSARRAKALREYFTAALAASGRELSVDFVAGISKTVELIALTEDLRARALRGADISADDLVRMQRLADVSVRRLHLPTASIKQAPTLGLLLRSEQL